MSSHRRAWFLLCAVPSALLLALSACGDDAPAAAVMTPADASSEFHPRDGQPEDEDAADAGRTDARPPPPVLPGCIGTSVALTPSGERAYASVNFAADGGAALRGDLLLDFGANGSTIDLKGFKPPGPPTPTFCSGDAAAPGALCSFKDFDFFGPWGTVQLVTADYSFLINSVTQAGIIGTDFLAVYPFTLEYTNARIWKGSATAFCTDAQLLGAGLVPIPSGGFYTNKSNTLRPLSDVISDPDASATAGYTVPNVPTVPIAIRGVSALAQLDTGYDDRIVRHSININEPLLAKLLAQPGTNLVRQAMKDLYLTTCVPGLSQLGSAYYLPAGSSVDFLAAGGGIGRHDTGTVVFVKERLPAAEKCGGIETWTVPAAQMGASFLVDAQAVVFDPVSSRVWLPK